MCSDQRHCGRVFLSTCIQKIVSPSGGNSLERGERHVRLRAQLQRAQPRWVSFCPIAVSLPRIHSCSISVCVCVCMYIITRIACVAVACFTTRIPHAASRHSGSVFLVMNILEWKNTLHPRQHSRERHLDIFTSSTLLHVSRAGKAPVSVPWQLSVASQAYAGIANSWNCGATYEAPRHTLNGAAPSNSCAAAMCAVTAAGPVLCIHARYSGVCR